MPHELDAVDGGHRAAFARNLGRLQTGSQFYLRMAAEALSTDGVEGTVIIHVPSKVDRDNPVEVKFRPRKRD